jgi:hypothetical protein
MVSVAYDFGLGLVGLGSGIRAARAGNTHPAPLAQAKRWLVDGQAWVRIGGTGEPVSIPFSKGGTAMDH